MITEERIKEILTKEGIKFHPKTGLEKLLVKLAGVETDEAKEILATNEFIEDAPEKVEKVKAPKLITAADVYAEFQALHAKLDSFEKQQQKIRKPFRHVFMTKKRLWVAMEAFKRNS